VTDVETPGPAGPPARDAAHAVFPGDTELARRCRALDWSATPLGPPGGWPAALRAVVRTCLESPFPINLWCGPELVLVYNDAYRRVLGAKHPRALGRPGLEVWAEIRGELEQMFARVRAGAPPVYAEDAPFVMERADGEPGGGAWFTFGLSPVRDDGGAIVAFFNPATETTGQVLARREAEAARAAAERATARIAQVFEQAPVAVAVTRGRSAADLVFELANPHYLELVPPGREVLGRPLREVLPELAPPVLAVLQRVLDSGEPFAATEFAVPLDRRGDGTPEDCFFNLVYHPLRGADGSVSGLVTVATEVTEFVVARREAVAAREQAEAARRAAEDANAAKAQFLAMMSHELRTPLNAISGYTQLLALGVHGAVTDAQAEALARVRASQQHLLGLINAVLDYAKLEAGSVHYDAADVDLSAALGEAAALVEPQAGAAGHALEVRPCPGAVARTDAEKLRRILLNLLANAVKFTAPGGRIVLACDRAPPGRGGVRVSVADTGRGIPADQLERVFEPFVQLGRSYSSGDEGAGLGLAISRDLARAMGGDLTAESTLGVGSTFTLALPAGGPGAAPGRPVPRRRATDRTPSGRGAVRVRAAGRVGAVPAACRPPCSSRRTSTTSPSAAAPPSPRSPRAAGTPTWPPCSPARCRRRGGSRSSARRARASRPRPTTWPCAAPRTRRPRAPSAPPRAGWATRRRRTAATTRRRPCSPAYTTATATPGAPSTPTSPTSPTPSGRRSCSRRRPSAGTSTTGTW
jgi:signal transduction histidine kinase